MYECLYGYTPFACDDRHQTKLKILQHKKTLVFPQPDITPEPTIEALDLMMSLLVEKEKRLCSRQYESNDYCRKIHGGRVVRCTADKNNKAYQGYFVYAGDAEDIKRHSFFKNINWDNLHFVRPPYVPRVRGWDDTKYFQEEEPISDIDTATTIDETNPAVAPEISVHPSQEKASQVSQHHQEPQNIVPSTSLKPPCDDLAVPDVDHGAGSGSQSRLLPARQNEKPMTGATLVGTRGHMDAQADTIAPENVKTKTKKREKKRPRDIILRDPIAGPAALETRKRGAFLGYEYRQPVSVKDIVEQVVAEDLARTGSKDHVHGGDGQDHELTLDTRVFLDAASRMSSSPTPRPGQQMLQYEHTLYHV